jgi:hypothetical protein
MVPNVGWKNVTVIRWNQCKQYHWLISLLCWSEYHKSWYTTGLKQGWLYLYTLWGTVRAPNRWITLQLSYKRRNSSKWSEAIWCLLGLFQYHEVLKVRYPLQKCEASSQSLPPVATYLMKLHTLSPTGTASAYMCRRVMRLCTSSQERGPNLDISYFLQALLAPRRVCCIHCLWSAVWRGSLNCGVAVSSKCCMTWFPKLWGCCLL